MYFQATNRLYFLQETQSYALLPVLQRQWLEKILKTDTETAEKIVYVIAAAIATVKSARWNIQIVVTKSVAMKCQLTYVIVSTH